MPSIPPWAAPRTPRPPPSLSPEQKSRLLSTPPAAVPSVSIPGEWINADTGSTLRCQPHPMHIVSPLSCPRIQPVGCQDRDAVRIDFCSGGASASGGESRHCVEPMTWTTYSMAEVTCNLIATGTVFGGKVNQVNFLPPEIQYTPICNKFHLLDPKNSGMSSPGSCPIDY